MMPYSQSNTVAFAGFQSFREGGHQNLLDQFVGSPQVGSHQVERGHAIWVERL
jgi:hypothetical protein